MVINPIVGVYIPIIRIPIKGGTGGMTIPNIATFDHGTFGLVSYNPWFVGAFENWGDDRCCGFFARAKLGDKIVPNICCRFWWFGNMSSDQGPLVG